MRATKTSLGQGGAPPADACTEEYALGAEDLDADGDVEGDCKTLDSIEDDVLEDPGGDADAPKTLP